MVNIAGMNAEEKKGSTLTLICFEKRIKKTTTVQQMVVHGQHFPALTAKAQALYDT